MLYMCIGYEIMSIPEDEYKMNKPMINYLIFISAYVQQEIGVLQEPWSHRQKFVLSFVFTAYYLVSGNQISEM